MSTQGDSMRNTSDRVDKRTVGIGLGIGIVLLPILALLTLRNGHSVLARVFSLGWLLLAVASIFSMKEPYTAKPSTLQKDLSFSSAPAPSQSREVISVSAAEIVAAYDENEIAADARFKGRYVRVEGSIEDIGKDIMGDIYVSIDGGGVDEMGLRSVQAFFVDSKADVIANLRTGQAIVIVGRVDGLMMNVLLRDSTVVQ